MCNLKEPEIEYLPKIGEPLSIKAKKQGRIESIAKFLARDEYMVTSYGKRIGRVYRYKKSILVYMCNRIIKSEKTTEKQKNYANDLKKEILSIPNVVRYRQVAMKIIKISKKLSDQKRI